MLAYPLLGGAVFRCLDKATREIMQMGSDMMKTDHISKNSYSDHAIWQHSTHLYCAHWPQSTISTAAAAHAKTVIAHDNAQKENACQQCASGVPFTYHARLLRHEF